MKSLSKFGFLLPVLTAIFIVLSLWSVNANRTTQLDVAIPLTTAILSSLLLWGLAHLLPTTAMATAAHLKIRRMGLKSEVNIDAGVNHKAIGNKM